MNVHKKLLLIFCFSLSFQNSIGQEASAQKNSDLTLHLLFEDTDSFKADKIDDMGNSLFFGIISEDKSHFPRRYLFVYNKEDRIIEIEKTEIEDINFSNSNETYWEYTYSEKKPKIFIYMYEKETGCYLKYPVKTKFAPPPPNPGPVE